MRIQNPRIRIPYEWVSQGPTRPRLLKYYKAYFEQIISDFKCPSTTVEGNYSTTDEDPEPVLNIRFLRKYTDPDPQHVLAA